MSATAPDDATVDVSPADGSRSVHDPAHDVPERYLVFEEIGRGGMGRVLRAYDPTLQREVALKQVTAGALDAESAERLVAEARAMAQLSHENVVEVYDVETFASGSVVVVMEYVAGATLREWQREAKRSWRETVTLYRRAGRGLAAAHAVGLLHRDFKPANVLVSHRLVKVADFGLAKVVGAAPSSSKGRSAPNSPDLTESGAVLGTPRYMAPEQHRGRVTLTPAADQYAFCVALWEGLCGRAPFDGEHMIRDKHRGPPPWRGAGVPGAIEQAVVRGLSPDPSDRWPSMNDLIERLSGDPTRRRNRLVGGALGLGAVAVAAIGVRSWIEARAARCAGATEQLAGVWDDERRARVESAMVGVDTPFAEAVWVRTDAALEAYADAWTAMHAEACEATARGDQTTEALDLRMACLHAAAVGLQATGDQLADADAAVVQNAHALVGGLRPLSRCADVEALGEDIEPPLSVEADAVDRVRRGVAEAQAAFNAGRIKPAQEKIDAVKQQATGIEYALAIAEVNLMEGMILEKLGEHDAAETALLSAFRTALRLGEPRTLATALQTLTHLVGYQQRRMEAGLRWARITAALAVGDTAREAAARGVLGSVLHAKGDYVQAEVEDRFALDLWVTAIGANDPSIAKSHNNIANDLFMQGKFPEAEAEYRRALEISEKALGADHPDVGLACNNLGSSLSAQGKYDLAEEQQRRALQIWEAAFGPEHQSVGLALYNLSSALQHQERHAEAEKLRRRVLKLWHESLGPEHPDVADAYALLAQSLQIQGRFEEAETQERKALAIREKVLGPEHPDAGMSHLNLGAELRGQGRYADAQAEYRRALATWERVLHPEHPRLAQLRIDFANLLLEAGHPAEALPLAEQGWQRVRQDDVRPTLRAHGAYTVARARWETGDRTEVRALAERALELYEAAGEQEAEQRDDVRSWLISLGVRRAHSTP